MDGTTEPIIAVIGYPIAGNPTQFALETGFAAAQIDCRVMSVNLSPDRVAEALAGMNAMNFVAAWVAPTCRTSVERLREADGDVASCAENPADDPPEGSVSADLVNHRSHAGPAPFDVVVHERSGDDQPPWIRLSMKHRVWPRLAAEALKKSQRPCRRLWWGGGKADVTPECVSQHKTALLEQVRATANDVWDALSLERIELVREPAQVRREGSEEDGVDVIVFSDSGDISQADWTMPSKCLVIDLNENWDPEYLIYWDRRKLDAAERSAVDCIRGADVHAACLSELTESLFDRNVEPEIFLDAIDEYLGV
ncbi:MAG: shikimate dehydrogenase [Rhodopirellula sp. JB053]